MCWLLLQRVITHLFSILLSPCVTNSCLLCLLLPGGWLLDLLPGCIVVFGHGALLAYLGGSGCDLSTTPAPPPPLHPSTLQPPPTPSTPSTTLPLPPLQPPPTLHPSTPLSDPCLKTLSRTRYDMTRAVSHTRAVRAILFTANNGVFLGATTD